MDETGKIELIRTQIEAHDRRQIEIELDYQPSGNDPLTEYLVEATMFLPKSLNVDESTWPREAFYRDLHNYVRLKMPRMAMPELLSLPQSPLLQLEQNRATTTDAQREYIYDAKMLACLFRGALRASAREIKRAIAEHHFDAARKVASDVLADTHAVLTRFRALVTRAQSLAPTSEPPADNDTRAAAAWSPQRVASALRLIDEYMSLNLEEYLRRMVVHLSAGHAAEQTADVRRQLLEVVLRDEAYRKAHNLPSVLTPGTDNEEYTHRLSFLKKFTQNILFLKVQRTATRKAWEEVLFAVAAGGAMAFALGIGLYAQSWYPQASFNFFIVAVIGYMLKDRIKEGLRKILYQYAGKFLYERTTRIIDPVTREEVGACLEKVDYGSSVKPGPKLQAYRAKDDLVLAAQGELQESLLRYRKVVKLHSAMLPKLGDGMSGGVTDIIRLNVDRLLYDMDDPEYFIDYIDAEDMSIEKITASKSYRVDLAFRFVVDDGDIKRSSTRLVQVVLDRNGIKRIVQGPWLRE